MDVSAEAADLVVKEGLQATETAVKLAGSGIKNVAALLLALSKQDYKVIGQASAARLAHNTVEICGIGLRRNDGNKAAVVPALADRQIQHTGISTASQERTTDDVRSSVLGKLEAMRQLSAERNTDRMKVKEHIR